MSGGGGCDLAGVEVAPVLATQTHALRHSVLRPHQRLDEMVYEGDTLESTLHLGAFCGFATSRRLVGVVTLSVAPMPGDPEPGDHRLRGMAVEPAVQGRGLGGRLLGEALDGVARRGGRRVWCNARVSATGFYRRHGFVPRGDAFDLPGIGPHYLLHVAVGSRAR